MLEANEIVAPIVFAEKWQGGVYSPRGEVRGTCFAIGGDYCLTAGHVVEAVNGCPPDLGPVIAFRSQGRWATAEIRATELLSADVGLVRFALMESTDMPRPVALPWRLEMMPLLTTVKTIGYPYGLSYADGEARFTTRAFLGHVVSTRVKYKPVGYQGNPFCAYELSYVAPEGLSGAPLLCGDEPTVVIGLIIGNNESKILFHQDSYVEKESEGEKAKTTVHEHYRYHHLGVSVMSSEIANTRSELLGKSIGEHLKEHGLIEQ